MMSGANVFLTGAPGAGKTYVLHQFIRRAEAAGKRIAVTASTGIAASHIGGTTIHSWSGLGIVDYLSEQDLDRLGSVERLVKRYNSVDTLVIDEVSMLHGQRLNLVNQVAKVLRASDKAFGGMQVILVGDLFQLPPVSRGSDVDFVHMSEAWQELAPQVCYITEQHRQQGSDKLLEFLEAMRSGEISEEHGQVITDRVGMRPGADEVLTRLYSHNVDVESINKQHLDAIHEPTKHYTMTTKGSKAKVEQLTKSLLAPEKLELKVGAEVMFVANNFAEGFVNGSRGRVIDFDKGMPVVRLHNGKIRTVEQHSWNLSEDGRIRSEAAQLPLRLAWAITIHKSQGMSLDAAEVDLSRAFTPGMGYVALSRVRSLDGLYLKGLNAMAMQLHPAIYGFDAELRQDSEHVAASVEDYVEPPATAGNKRGTAVDDKLFEKLKVWRAERAKADGVATYMVAHNSTLTAVAQAVPATLPQLLGLPGFGPKKIEKYGPQILAIVAAHLSK